MTPVYSAGIRTSGPFESKKEKETPVNTSLILTGISVSRGKRKLQFRKRQILLFRSDITEWNSFRQKAAAMEEALMLLNYTSTKAVQ